MLWWCSGVLDGSLVSCPVCLHFYWWLNNKHHSSYWQTLKVWVLLSGVVRVAQCQNSDVLPAVLCAVIRAWVSGARTTPNAL